MEQTRLMVTSSKGGIGKSTVATGLALALCEQGMKVHLKWSNPGIPVPAETEYIGSIQIM